MIDVSKVTNQLINEGFLIYSCDVMDTIHMFETAGGNCVLFDFQPDYFQIVCRSEYFDSSKMNTSLAYVMVDHLNNMLCDNGFVGKWILNITVDESLSFYYVASIPDVPTEAIVVMARKALDAITHTFPQTAYLVAKMNRNEATLDDIFQLEDQMHITVDPLLMLLSNEEDDKYE